MSWQSEAPHPSGLGRNAADATRYLFLPDVQSDATPQHRLVEPDVPVRDRVPGTRVRGPPTPTMRCGTENPSVQVKRHVRTREGCRRVGLVAGCRDDPVGPDL